MHMDFSACNFSLFFFFFFPCSCFLFVSLCMSLYLFVWHSLLCGWAGGARVYFNSSNKYGIRGQGRLQQDGCSATQKQTKRFLV